mgnify:CR=1 FL=1
MANQDQNAVFDNYNEGQKIVATTNEFDAVKGFFLRKTEGSIDSANSLTDTILTVCNLHGISPMAMIDELAEYLNTFVDSYGLTLVGGCCGTTPDHIKAIATAVSQCKPRKLPVKL